MRSCLPTGALALALLCGSAAVVPVHAQKGKSISKSGQAASRALHLPVRMTAGSSNQWMGALTPDGGGLYFVSDRNVSREIFVQKPIDSGARLLFESDADVSWPLPSPDGKYLAYISYRADATGDLCVLSVKSRDRRCLTGPGSAEMQPVWLDGGRALGALVRTELHGNYQLRRFAVDGKGEQQGKLLLERNMLGVAATDDGKWLAYVPVERVAERVGVTFFNRGGQMLRLQRLDRLSDAPVEFTPDLPGLTGFPTFSRDGQWLYFSQYLNDTNGDGAIDGNDHSVLFRVPFAADAADPVAGGHPQQLTSAQWNCRYPLPATERLIMTCAHESSLDIYSLPLTGAVPADWDRDRLRGELHVARNHWTKLLLYAHMQAISVVERRAASGRASSAEQAEYIEAERNMAWLHIELREYESATFHAQRVAAMAAEGKSDARAQLAADWARIALELATHRKADVALTHGQLSDQYVASEKERVERLRTQPGHSDDARALSGLVIGEILGDIGQKDAEKPLLDKIVVSSVSDPLTLELYGQRAVAVHTLRGDRQALLTAYWDLAEHAAFDTLTRLHYAEAFVDELFRGVPHERRPALVEPWLRQLQDDSELALMLRIASWLLQLSDERQEEVRAGIFELYKQNRQPDRRRALVLATVRTAARVGNEYLQYQFATSWASWLKRTEPERKHAETLYRTIVLERAYTELDKGEVKKARATFYAATVQTTSLEAHIGFIEALVREGRNDLQATYDKRYARTPDDPAYAFARAYIIARDLPDIVLASGPGVKPGSGRDAEYKKEAKQALELLARAAEVWPRSMEIEHVRGTILHRRARRLASKDDAVDAHAHYLMALDLARGNVRFQAALYTQLGLLQAELGNHRLALRYFTERARLPVGTPARDLSFRVAMARSAFHADRMKQAVEQAERALALVDEFSELGKYRPLALDRLAFYHQASGQSNKALRRYEQLIPLLDKAPPADIGAPVNKLKARLGAAVAALGSHQYKIAVKRIDELWPMLDSSAPLRPAEPRIGIDPRARGRLPLGEYRLLLHGLQAHAQRGLDNYDGAEKSMRSRMAIIEERFKKRKTDADTLELARMSYHLAEYSYRAGKKTRARKLLERGLKYSDEYNKRTGSDVNPVGLRLIQAYAELHLYGEVPLSSYKLDLRARLAADYEFICKYRSPSWRPDRFLFSLYLAMLKVSRTW